MIKFIRINGSTKNDRHEAIDEIKETIATGGGWITDYRMFSNKSICIQFEISPIDVMRLFERCINLKSIKIYEESMILLSSFLINKKCN